MSEIDNNECDGLIKASKRTFEIYGRDMRYKGVQFDDLDPDFEVAAIEVEERVLMNFVLTSAVVVAVLGAIGVYLFHSGLYFMLGFEVVVAVAFMWKAFWIFRQKAAEAEGWVKYAVFNNMMFLLDHGYKFDCKDDKVYMKGKFGRFYFPQITLKEKEERDRYIERDLVHYLVKDMVLIK